MSTRRNVPKASASLVTKVNTLTATAELKCKALFTHHQFRTSNDISVDGSDQTPIFNCLHRRREELYNDKNKNVSM